MRKLKTIFGTPVKGKVRPFPYQIEKGVVRIFLVFTLVEDLSKSVSQSGIRYEFWTANLGFDQDHAPVVFDREVEADDAFWDERTIYGMRTRTMIYAANGRVGHLEEDAQNYADECIRIQKSFFEKHDALFSSLSL